MISLQTHIIQGQGQRANQEDSFFPKEGEQKSDLYLVCDGVGGAEKGEVASQLVVKTMSDFCKDRTNKPIDEHFIQEAVQASEGAIHAFLQEHSEAKGMGTTLALLHVGTDRMTAAHIGDSRIYHFREGTIIWQSKDHSWVNEMLERGLLSEEQARDHPKQNIITRALQGDLDKKVNATVQEIVDVQKGDTFLLCSDGMLESYTDAMLSEMVAENSSLPEKARAVDLMCNQHSKDNYTAWLINATSASGADIFEAQPVPTTTSLTAKVKKIVHDFFKK